MQYKPLLYTFTVPEALDTVHPLESVQTCQPLSHILSLSSKGTSFFSRTRTGSLLGECDRYEVSNA